MIETVATVWRDDGVINYVTPPVLIANTFLSIAVNHPSWLCYVMEDFATVLQPGDVNPEIAEAYGVSFDIMTTRMRENHGTEGPQESGRAHRGTPDMFEGMVYGTMHPTELAVLGEAMSQIITLMRMAQPQSEEGEQLIASWGLWAEAAKRYVRPHEMMGFVVERSGKA